MKSDNIILIGMPGAGKSTIGVLLAKELGYEFLDTDIEIQNQEGRLLQEIVDEDGSDELRRIESRVCQSVDGECLVVSTGGSVVYCPDAMAHLKTVGELVWLDVPFAEIERRISNFSTRGLAKRPDQSLQDLFDERFSLYEKYAEHRIDCDQRSPESIVAEIAKI